MKAHEPQASPGGTEPEPAEDLAEVERAWAAEIARRAHRALAGESRPLPWPEVRRQIEVRLARELAASG